ncbi:MAG: WYL domain-containing protein [Lachnospiraceae bacterium]|nr:WYL domain-containing protein [Lachnospiraceae bacterium]
MEKNRDKQRLRLLYIAKMLFEESDEEHGLTREEIEKKLLDEGVVVERKTFYQDIRSLNEFGLNIDIFPEGKKSKYRLLSRNFELAELKLLVDSVQSSRFISIKKSNELIKKLSILSSRYDAEKLQRQVYVANRVKSENEKIYYAVDHIHEAINSDRKIEFIYNEWLPDCTMRPKYDGAIYHVSPWAMLWDNQNYYLIGYSEEHKEVRHYRVDKMQNVNITEEKRGGEKEFEEFDLATYSQSMFGMFGGKLETVRLRVNNEVAGVFFDRFGTDIVVDRKEDYLIVEVLVNVSEQFLGWILGVGNGVKIISPDDIVQQVKVMLEERSMIYDKNK